MAYQQIITGFEGGDFTGLTDIGGTIIAGAARSGSYGLHCEPAGGGSAQYGARIGAAETFAAFTMHAAYLQFWVRFNTEPTAAAGAKCWFGGIGSDIAIWVEGNGALGLNTHRWGITSSLIGTQTFGILPLGIAAGWYRVILRVWTYNLGNTTGPAHGVIIDPGYSGTDAFGTGDRVCTALITQVNAANQLVFLASGGLRTSGNSNTYTTLQAGVLGGITGGGTSTNWSLDIDDVIFLSATGANVRTIGKWNDPISGNALNYMPLSALAPTYGSIFFYDQIELLPISGQGGYDGYMVPGDYTAVNEVPMGVGSVVGYSSGAASTYGHSPLAPVNKEVEAYILRMNVTSSPQGIHAILGVLPGGAPQPPLLTTPYTLTTYTQAPAAQDSVGEMPTPPLNMTTGAADQSSPSACVVATGYRGKLLPVAQFNPLQMGLRSKVAGTVTLKNLFIEALVPTLGKDYSGPGGPFPPSYPSDDPPVPGPGPAGPPPDEPPGFPDPCDRTSCRLSDVIAADAGGGVGCNTDAATPPVSGDCPV